MDSMPILDPRHNRIKLSDLIISTDMVAKKMKKLKPTKSAGPVGLHPRVRKKTADTINVIFFSFALLFIVIFYNLPIYHSPSYYDNTNKKLNVYQCMYLLNIFTYL